MFLSGPRTWNEWPVWRAPTAAVSSGSSTSPQVRRRSPWHQCRRRRLLGRCRERTSARILPDWFGGSRSSPTTISTWPIWGRGSPRVVPPTPLQEFQCHPARAWLLARRAMAARAAPQQTPVHDLARPTLPRVELSANFPMADPPKCQEGFTAAPFAWCGNPRNPTRFTWSPDSRWVAFLSAAGDLEAFDLANAPASYPRFTMNQVSGSVGQFAFQP